MYRSWTALLIVLWLNACASAPPPRPRRSLPPNAQSIDQIVRREAARHGVDPALVRGVIQVESGFRPDARSSVGARGLMQLMPRTAASLAKKLGWEHYDLEDPAFNVAAGTAYLAYLLKRFDGDKRLALAAYHTGPARVSRWVARGTPLPQYSRRYIRAVLRARQQLATIERLPLKQPAELDRSGLRTLLRQKLYGPRADEPLVQSPALDAAGLGGAPRHLDAPPSS